MEWHPDDVAHMEEAFKEVSSSGILIQFVAQIEEYTQEFVTLAQAYVLV